MRRHDTGRRWRRVRRNPDRRFRYSDRLSGAYLPDVTHIPRSLR